MSNGASEGDFDLPGPEMLDRSSADFDQALREIDRRSPAPLFDGVNDLDEEGVAGRDGTGSSTPGLERERSKTDLRGRVNTVFQHQSKNSGREHGNVKRPFPTTH
jgi:hypothetical protein